MKAAIAIVVIVAFVAYHAKPSVAFHQGFHCGHADPELIRAHNLHDEPLTQPQTYHTVTVDDPVPRVRRRRAQTVAESYDTDGGLYLTIDDAHSAGLTRKLRVKLAWDVIDAGDVVGGVTYQCSSVGQTITVASSGSSHTCTESDVLITGNTRYEQAVIRSQFAESYLEDALFVKPIQDDLHLHVNVQNTFPALPASFANTDLVVVMTARPEPGRPIAAYARCLQADQHGRCTVGQFNWIPSVLVTDPLRKNSGDVISSERHTAMHEIIHVLGGMRPSSAFVGENGLPITAVDPAGGEGILFEVDNGEALTGATSGSGHYNKPTTWIITPRVQAMVREHFGCPTLKGMALEDVPLSGGAGAHWEARLMGPEVMSYGSGSGEAYFSDLTWAFLEDTNQYRVNYTVGGRLIADIPTAGQCNKTGSPSIIDFIFGNDQNDDSYVPPPPRTPGALRWGRDAGCDFVAQSAGGWPERYKCTVDAEYGCSPDNRMSAVCTIRSDWYFPTTEYSRGDITVSSGENVPGCAVAPCPLPTMFQYFTSSQVSNPTTSGGFSMSMDFAPVRIGYWNCQDEEPSEEGNVFASSEGVTGSEANFTQLGTSKAQEEDENLSGGQCRCKECRCFISSLIALTSSSFNPTFPRIGLCYKSNCYKPDYLQVGIRDPFVKKVFWYKCPPSGGKMYIPNFSGAFHCPEAVEFCTHEEITGIRHPEFQIWQLWVIVGLVFGTIGLLLLSCICPCIREPFVACLKRTCGANHFVRRNKAKKGEDEGTIKVKAPEKCGARGLLAVNGLTLVISLALVGALAYLLYNNTLSWYSPVFYVFVILMFLSCAGCCGARKKARGTSCVVITYFFSVFFFILFITYIMVDIFVINDNLEQTVDDNWDLFEETLDDHYNENDPREQQVADATEYLESNFAIFGGFLGFVILLLILGLYFAGRIIEARNVSAMTFTILNNMFIVGGVLTISAAIAMQYTKALGTISNLEPIVGPVILGLGILGALLIIIPTIGLCGVRRLKSGLLLLGIYSVLGVICFGACLYGARYCFAEANDAAETVAELDADDIADLETERTPDQLEDDLQGLFRSLGVGCLIICFEIIIIFVAEAVFVPAKRQWYKEEASKLYYGEISNSGVANTGPGAMPYQNPDVPPELSDPRVADYGTRNVTDHDVEFVQPLEYDATGHQIDYGYNGGEAPEAYMDDTGPHLSSGPAASYGTPIYTEPSYAPAPYAAGGNSGSGGSYGNMSGSNTAGYGAAGSNAGYGASNAGYGNSTPAPAPAPASAPMYPAVAPTGGQGSLIGMNSGGGGGYPGSGGGYPGGPKAV